MSTEIKKEIALEIAHVLFIDIVGFSKLSINDQNAAVEELSQVVRGSEQFQKAAVPLGNQQLIEMKSSAVKSLILKS